jgi:hypothetical protein
MSGIPTHVIVLAQGSQKRLNTTHPKCLLPLPACGGRSILYRTLHHVWSILDRQQVADRRVTVVTWYEVKKWFELNDVWLYRDETQPRRRGIGDLLDFVSLADPGNSSLKGIARFLASDQGALWRGDRTIVLLGDVVYSWRCLDALFTESITDNLCFAGSGDLSPGGGELWGIRWDRSVDRLMMDCLDRALLKHPRFEDYQPGQLRGWLWEVDKDLDEVARETAVTPTGYVWRKRTWFRAVDDYTMDVDVPEHIPLLMPASQKAAADDREHGVRW